VLGFRHPKVQRLRRLVERRRARHDERSFVLEGGRVLGEALAAGARIESVFVVAGTDDPTVDRAREAGVPVIVLEPGVMERVADTATPQPVVGVVGFIDVALDALLPATLVVVCVDIRDPGNLGTVLRSAEGAGAGGVVCCDGSVDLYNPKVVRASAGSIFHVPVVAGGQPVEVLERLGTAKLQRLGTVAHGGDAPEAVDLRAPVALALGNEAHGLPGAVDACLDRRVTIPMAGRTDSLNVGMAAAVLCFEAARQRRAR
jgi:RNA methyltransferase, TrmH family